MCGIAGFYNAVADDQLILNSLACLKHRGPDAQNYYHKDRTALVHTRLSIIELSELGAQPYYFQDLVLVFNGELYNYKEVRAILIKLGYTFESNSDTEVLIKSFHCWKEKCADYFIGMFAFAVFSTSEQKLWLFRDRLGVKPLYYYTDQRQLYFASELRALMVFDIPVKISADSLSAYFRFGFIGGSNSIYENVSKLEPGTYLTIDSNGVKKVRYWSSQNQAENPVKRKESDWIDELEALMTSSFNYRMVSDVPVGIFLSGGIDSSLLAAILQKEHGNIHTFTIGFEERDFDESGYAEKVAAYLRTKQSTQILRLDEAREMFFRFYDIYDEPFADTSGIPTACVTSLAKNSGMKVVLSADGGDELFGGYSHYQRAFSFYKKLNAVPRLVRKSIQKSISAAYPAGVRAGFINYNLEHKTYALEELLGAGTPTEFFESFIANQSVDEIEKLLNHTAVKRTAADSSLHPLQQMMGWDLNNFLPDDLLVKVDRATMYHSLECREPFLDHRLVEFSARLPLDLKIRDGKGKYILRQLLKRYLPEEYFERPKKGFSVPVFSWFSKELDVLFENYLSEESLSGVPFLNAGEVLHEYKKYRIYKAQNKPYNIEKMWRILSFMMWFEKYGRPKF